MAGNNWEQGFSMPMFRSFVPEKLRPWLYVYLAFTFQLSSGVYLGGMEHIRGSLSLMREDLMMCLYASLAGLAITFPILFRTKFRFTNRTLLILSASVIAVLTLASAYVTFLPLLWAMSFFVGVFKLQGTFECMSNIQLWMTPKRDFGVFFPVLHIFIMCSMAVSEIAAVYLCYYCTWRYMNYLMAGVMIFNVLWLFLLTKHVRFMKPMPFVAIDWLGAILWALVVLQISYIFCYGEYYDWWFSPTIRTLTFTTIATATLALIRMLMIRHPYIEPRIFRTPQLPKFLLVALVVEAILATQHVLEEIFFEAGPEWHNPEKAILQYPVIAGIIAACIFALIWLVTLKRSNLKLIALGIGAFAAYAIIFYHILDAHVNIEKLYLPMFLRGFATTMLGITLLYQLKTFMHFMVFFQSVAVFQSIHLVIAAVIGAAIYAYGVRYFMSDALANYGMHFDATSAAASSGALQHHTGEIMRALQLVTLKRLFGIVAYVSLGTFLLILLWDIPLMRKTRARIPSWGEIAYNLNKRLHRQKIADNV